MTTTAAGEGPVERGGVRPGVRYVLCPGMVTSQNDGKEHYIGPMALARLYGVRPDECEIYEPAPQWREFEFRQAQVRTLDLIRLTPRYDGDYSLPRVWPNMHSPHDNRPTPIPASSGIGTGRQQPETGK